MRYREPFDDDDDYEYSEPRHSGFGIASFVTALAAGLLVLVVFGIAGVIGARNGDIDEKSPEAVLLGLAVIGGLLVAMLGIGLGIAGVCQHRRKKVFAVLGLVINAVVTLGVVLVMIVGILMG